MVLQSWNDSVGCFSAHILIINAGVEQTLHCAQTHTDTHTHTMPWDESAYSSKPPTHLSDVMQTPRVLCSSHFSFHITGWERKESL